MAEVFNIREGSEGHDPHFCRIYTIVGHKLIRALTYRENSWLSIFWLDTDGKILSEQIVHTFSKKKTDQDAEYTHTLFQQKDNNQSNVSENTRKNSRDAIRIFLRTI